jgi:hypothetical protein
MSWFGNKKRTPKKTRRTVRAPLLRLSALRLSLEPLEERTMLTMLPPVSYAAGTAPTSVQVGDFNGDGKSDIVALNGGTNQVSVLLANGDGTFQAPITSATAPFSNKVSIGDFNDDGKLDIVTNNTTSVDIERGDGDGHFEAPVPYYIGALANDVEVGDFNDDGFDDIVTASFSYGGTSQLLMNDGTGAFPTVRNLAISSLGREVEVEDLNHDGHLDLVESSFGSLAGVLMGDGDGTFQSMSLDNLGIAQNDMAFGDFNHDGNVDVAVTDGANLGVLLGNGMGGFYGGSTYFVSLASNLQVSDLNGDGNLDVLDNKGDVAFGRGDGTFYAPVGYAPLSGNTLAIADFNGDGSPDIATATVGGASVSLNAHNDAAALAGAVGLIATVPDTVTAGVPFAVTVSAVDANGNVVPGFLGTVGITSIPGHAPVSYSFGAADGGIHLIANGATLTAAGNQTVTVTSPFLPDATATVHVNAAAAVKFSVSADATATAGLPVNVTVSAVDAYGNVAQGYTGPMYFTSSDAKASLPAAYTFTASDAGSHTFAPTLKTAGPQTISASDVATIPIHGTSSTVSVTPAAASRLLVSGGGGFIGSPHAVTISALDAFGNIASGYSGTVHLATSDPNSTVSADAPLTNGVGTFTVTPMTLGTQTLTASDASGAALIGSESIQVTPGWAVRFVATPLSATTAGQTQMMTITAYDAFGDVSSVYTGTLQITSGGRFLGYATFTPADQGVRTVPVTLTVAGLESVTIADVTNIAVNFTQSGILVSPASAASLSVTSLHGTTAGVAQDLTITARDAYGNIATGYRGTIAMSSSDTLASFPASYTFTATDAGTHTFSVIFKTSGGQTFAVSDTANATNLAFTSSQRDIPVTAAAVAGISVRASSNVTAGVAFSITVSVVDAYGNAVPGYTGTLHFTGPSGSGNLLPPDYTFTAADAGTHVFSVTLASTGTQTINMADTTNTSLKGSTSVKVTTATTSGGGGGGGGGTATGGGGGGTATGGGGGTSTGGGGGGGKLTGA